MSVSNEDTAKPAAGQTQDGAVDGLATERGPKFRLSPQISIGCSEQTNFKPRRTFVVTQDANSRFQLEVSVELFIKGIVNDAASPENKQKDEEEVILDCDMHLSFDLRLQGDHRLGHRDISGAVQSATSKVKGTLDNKDTSTHARTTLQALDDLPVILYHGLLTWHVKSQVHQMMVQALRSIGEDPADGAPLDVFELYAAQSELESSMQPLSQSFVLSVITSGFHGLRDLADEYLGKSG